jgi:hypothetical protein
MAERRSLVQEIKPEASVDRSIEEKFVFSGKPKPREETPPRRPAQNPETAQTKTTSTKPLGRVPLTTRVRADFAIALKRASLERQLSGASPNTLQDILEQALEPWLRSNGYLS